MALSCGIIGLPMSGKTTFFNLLTGSHMQTGAFAGAYSGGFSGGKAGANTGHARIPDERVDYLVKMYSPRKTTYAQLEIVDVPGLKAGGDGFLAAVRECDALALIVRAFQNENVPQAEGGPDVMRDIGAISTELLLVDLQLVETRLDNIRSGRKKRPDSPLETAALEKSLALLTDEKPLAPSVFTEDEREALGNVVFVTGKPLLILINLDEGQFKSGQWPQKQQAEAYCAARGYTLMEVCAQLEEEISRLPEDERAEFMDELGVKESGVSRLARALYGQLKLVSFLTTGEDEVRAWTIPQGLPARQAAGKIHSDIERGFIRAETVAFEHLKEVGSMAAVRDKGYFRLEGKEYPVSDGDIISFRFNV